MTYSIIEDQWTEEFSIFLVDEGSIQYAFQDIKTAKKFQQRGRLDFMLLTDISNISHDTMLDPNEFRAWSDKIQRCIIIDE